MNHVIEEFMNIGIHNRADISKSNDRKPTRYSKWLMATLLNALYVV